MPTLTFDTYGKTRVRLTQVLRNGDTHEVIEIAVAILFEGDFAESYTAGDNRGVLPTDTMRNTVYVLARQSPIVSIENFGGELARHFLSRLPHLHRVKIEISQTPWARMGAHGTAFVRAGAEYRTATVNADRNHELYVSGIRDLEILKTGKSGFANFMRDEYTTLLETRDRLLGTVLNADWTYPHGAIDFNQAYESVRQTLLETFAAHESRSVQETLFAMAEKVITEYNIVEEIHLVMPNKHRLLFDLSRFGLDNPNQIFVSTNEPSGYIEARIKR